MITKTKTYEKGYGKHDFTYASPEDPKFKKALIKLVELLTGKKFVQRIYNELIEEGVTPMNVWSKTLEKLNIKVDYDQTQLDKIPTQGPVIFIANHPFGIVDGVIFCDLVTKKRKDYFLMVHEVLSREPIMSDHLLPVDFRKNKKALQTNIESKKEAFNRLNNGESLVIFPSGGVATRFKLFGKVEEWPWKKSICGHIHKAKCTVVPMFFHGKNSELFQTASRISMTVRLGLLLQEARNKKGKTFRVEIGNPIPYEHLQHLKDRQKLIDYLYRHTLTDVGNKVL